MDLCGIMGWFSGTAGWPPCPVRPFNRLSKVYAILKKINSDSEEGCLKLLSTSQKLCFKSPGHRITVTDECLI